MVNHTGTPSSLLPLEMGECVYQQGDDAKMLLTLTEPAVVTQLDLPSDWNPLLLLKTLTELSPPADALIDAGALVTGMSNRQVAVHLLPLLPASTEGVVYLESSGMPIVPVRGRAIVRVRGRS